MNGNPKKRPKTPPATVAQPSECLFQTPHSSQQLRQALGSIPSSGNLDRSIRLFLTKVGKGLDRQNTTLAAQDRELILVRHEMEEVGPKERFAKVPDVARAGEEMYKLLDLHKASEKAKK